MSTDKTFHGLDVSLDANATHVRALVTSASEAVIKAAVAFRAGGRGCGELFDAVDALRRATEQQTAIEVKRHALERCKARAQRGVKRLG